MIHSTSAFIITPIPTTTRSIWLLVSEDDLTADFNSDSDLSLVSSESFSMKVPVISSVALVTVYVANMRFISDVVMCFMVLARVPATQCRTNETLRPYHSCSLCIMHSGLRSADARLDLLWRVGCQLLTLNSISSIVTGLVDYTVLTSIQVSKSLLGWRPI